MPWSGATPRRSNPSRRKPRRPERRRSSSPATSPSRRNASRPRRRPSRTYGRIDILVNVAGGSGPIGKTGVETTPQEFDDIVTLNMNGCFHTMRGVLPTMMAQRYGKIVNVGGTFGMRGRAGRMAYSASKWGLRGITKSFALEVGAYNINVNCVAPGMVDGPRFRDKVCADMATRLGITVDEAVERHAADYALKRVIERCRRRQCLPVPCQRCLAPDHRHRSAGRWRLGDAVRAPMTTADLVIHGGKVVSPDSVIEASVAIQDGHIIAVGSEAAMPPARETLDARGLACAARRHRRARAFPRSGLSAQGGLADRHGGRRVRRRHHRVRHAQHHPAHRHGVECWPTSTASPARRRTSISGFTPCSARTRSSTCLRWSRAASSASSSTWATRSARSRRLPPARCSKHSRSVAPHRQARLAACRDQFDHGAARDPDARRRPHRSARSSRVAPGGRRDRGREPRRDPRRVDRRAHPHPAHLLGRGTAPAARGQGARRRHHRRDLPAISDALERRLCALRRRHPRQSAGARGAQPGAAVGGARRRHHRPDRDRSRAACARGKDAQRHLDRRLRLSRRRDADAADADRGQRRADEHHRITYAGAPPTRRRSGAFIRARASSQAGAEADIAVVDLGREWTIDDAQAAVALEDHAVARTAGAGAADPHAGARPLRDAGPRAGRRTRAAGAARSTPSSICRPPRRAMPTRPCKRSSAAATAAQSERAA